MPNIKLSLTTALSAVSAAAGALTLAPPRNAQAEEPKAMLCANTWCNPGGGGCQYVNNYYCNLDAQGCLANIRCGH